MVNKTFKENLGPKPLLCTEKGKLKKFEIIFINIYGKFNVIFYTVGVENFSVSQLQGSDRK